MIIGGLLIDLDGVLRQWDPAITAEAERLAGLPAGALLRVAFAPDLLALAVTGRIDDPTWRRQVATRLAATYPSADAERAVALWSAPCGAVNEAVLTLVRVVRQRVPVVLVTNATSRLAADLDRLGLTSELDHLISSADVGASKPQPAIFQAALARLGLAATRALFVDDTLGHVQAAAALGLHTHHFQSVTSLSACLDGYRLLDPVG